MNSIGTGYGAACIHVALKLLSAVSSTISIAPRDVRKERRKEKPWKGCKQQEKKIAETND